MFERMKGIFNGDGMVGPAFIMLVSTIVGGACNFFFQISMQNLIPGQVSELNTLLAILTIISVPSTTVGNILIRYVAKYKAEGRESAISWLLRKMLLAILICGVVAGIILVVVLNIPSIHDALKLTSSSAIILLAFAVFFSLLIPIGSGPLQGMQKWTIYGIQSVGNYVLKLIIGFSLVVLGWGVAGAIGGVLVGAVFATTFLICHHLELYQETRRASRER